ncbi:hypothetical protein V7056_08630 [Bacillus sp. JJ664]
MKALYYRYLLKRTILQTITQSLLDDLKQYINIRKERYKLPSDEKALFITGNKIGDSPYSILSVRAIQNLVAKKDFDKARTEWDFESYLPKGDEHFETHCELCNHRVHSHNF